MNTASAVDLHSIEEMSSVPTKKELKQLYEKSLLAEQDIQKKLRSMNLSKLHHLPGNIGLCPVSLNPNETVLSGMGAARVVEGAIWKHSGGGTIGNKDIMTVLNDKCMPFCGGSNGPNGVLTDCQDAYGENRVNLFYHNENETKRLLVDYLKLRDSELGAIFHLFVEHLTKTEFINEYKLDPMKDSSPENTLCEELQDDYKNVCSMFKKLDDVTKSKNDLENYGIRCVSFCQTWWRKNSGVGDSQFSVMSPHFQTRFYVVDDDKVLSSGVSYVELTSYIKIIEYFNTIMDKPYGIGGGGQAFVNLDQLANELNY